MKKKKIREIPYLPCGRIAEGKEFFASAAAVEIGGEEHLIVDIYGRKDRKIPLLRGAYKKTDWAIYYPKDDIWERGSIGLSYAGHGELKAVEDGRRATVGWSGNRARSGNISMRNTDIDAIFRFVSGVPAEKKPWHSWHEELRSIESDVKKEQAIRREKRRETEMKERHADTLPVPEEFTEWLTGRLSGYGFLYYRKKNGRAEIRCSRCGEDWEGYYRTGDSYEAQFRVRVDEPVSRGTGVCPYCRQTGIYKAAGRMKGVYGINTTGYLIQPFRGSGIVLREFMAEKLLSLEEKEQVSLHERSRAYYMNDREQVDWNMAGVLSGDYWAYQNVGGMANLKMNEGPVWRPSWDLIRGTAYGHSGCREYLERVLLRKKKEECPRWYFWNYGHKPYMEMLVKRGLWHLAEAAISGYEGIVNAAAGTPEDLLGIYPYRMKLLLAHEGDVALLRILQAERRQGLHLKEIWIIKLWLLKENSAGIERILHFMGIQRFLNRVEKYAGTEIREGWAGPAAGIAEMYLDYLNMQEAAGADMSDQIIQHPRNLAEEHERLVTASNEKKNAELMRKKDDEYPQIAGNYRRLSRQFRHAMRGLLIRPASSASEIIREGQTLHHCVGGDSYLRKHDRGETYILFLRTEQHPKAPYVTVEIDAKTLSIRQWYGIRDTKPDKEDVEAWLDEYVGILRRYGGNMEAAREAMQPVTEELILIAAAG